MDWVGKGRPRTVFRPWEAGRGRCNQSHPVAVVTSGLWAMLGRGVRLAPALIRTGHRRQRRQNGRWSTARVA